MIQLRLLITICLLFFGSQAGASQKELPLQGSCTVRAAWFFKVCDIRIHAPDDTRIDNVLDGRPLALEIEYARSISKETLVKYGNEGLESAHGSDEINSFQEQTERLNNAYVDVDEGDVYRLDFQPENGISLTLNGKPVIAIQDADFGLFYLEIWLGDHSRANSIKSDLFPSS